MAASIELRTVSRRYRIGSTDVWALRDVDLVIESGTAVAVVGPSGSGKSTLLHLCGALDVPTSGAVHVLGETRLEAILGAAAAVAADVVVIDSIQTVYTEALESAPGNVGQVRECSGQLMRFAKESGTTVVVPGFICDSCNGTLTARPL